MLDHYVTIPALVGWFFLGKTNVDSLRAQSSAAGRFVSARLSSLPGWDAVAEPMIISQVARIFICMHSFVQGLTTDNTNVTEVRAALQKMESAVVGECRKRE